MSGRAIGQAALLVWLAGAWPAWAQRGPALVEVTPVIEQSVSPGQTFVATIMPSKRAVVGSAVDGRVVEFLVEEGDRVEKNAPLAKLLTETIKLELEAAQAELELRKQELKELENGSRPEEIEQAEARMDAARVAFDFFEKERQRLVRLRNQNATSQSEFDRAVYAAIESKERYDEAVAAHKLAVDGPRPEKIAQAKARVMIQDALVRKLNDQIAKHTMISRFDGYVSAEHTEIGQWVAKGDPVAEVVALDEVEIMAKVVETHIPFIHVGDSVPVKVHALPEESFTGRVVAVVPQADVRSRTFPVNIRVENKITEKGQPLLKAGMMARVTLPTGTPRQAMLVPKDALVLGGPSPTVWIVQPGSIKDADGGMQQAVVNAVPVQLGAASGKRIQVQGDLKPGRLVVFKGNERIQGRPGQPAQVTWVQKQTQAGKNDNVAD